MNSTNTKTNKALKIFTSILGGIFFIVCALIVFFNITHEYHIVTGSSMEPTLNYGSTDGVFVSKIKPFTRGDLIVANKGEKDANGKDIYVIKRLIAIGGDKIKISQIDYNYRIILIINGTDEQTVLDEPYLFNYNENVSLFSRFNKMVADYNLSLDENGFLTIEQDEIFYLGDNRSVSNDCSIYGPKKRELVVGKVDYIAYGNTNAYWQVIKQFFGGK